jgi:23S rRNA pseudouridine2457 synthase
MTPSQKHRYKNTQNSNQNKPSSIIVFNKPYRVICQFSPSGDKITLAKYITTKNYYPAGRLDYDSEGLLILTNNGALQAKITHPKFHLPKEYWVQVEGEITDKAINMLTSGVMLKDGLTQRALVKKIEPPTGLWPRNPPVRYRETVPTSWISMTITEGRNRQVRRMTASVGFPTLRLIRHSIGPLSVNNLKPGDHLNTFFSL